MMENIPCLNKSCNRLDKYYFLTQRWVDGVMVTVSGKVAYAIFKILYQCYHLFLITQRVKMKLKCVSTTTNIKIILRKISRVTMNV